MEDRNVMLESLGELLGARDSQDDPLAELEPEELSEEARNRLVRMISMALYFSDEEDRKDVAHRELLRQPIGERMSADRRPYDSLADAVRRARTARGMSQRRLSRALGMSDGYAGHLETGRFRPAVETLKGLAGVLGIAYGELAVLAGYISPDELENPVGEIALVRLNEVDDLTDEEWESVRDFVGYVRSRRAGR